MRSTDRAADAPAALLRPGDVAKLLGCSEWWVKEQARQRRIPFAWIGGSYRFTHEHLADIVRRCEVLPIDGVPVSDGTASGARASTAALPEPVSVLKARRPRRASRDVVPSSTAA